MSCVYSKYNIVIYNRNFYIESESKGAAVDTSDSKNIEGV